MIILSTIIVSFRFTAAAQAQQITLNEKNVSLETALRDIRKQSGYIIFFDKSLLRNLPPVTFKVNKANLQETLLKCLEGQPLTFSIVDKTVIIKSADGKFEEQHNAVKETTTGIRGHVIDERDNSMPGVTVKNKNGNQVAITDGDGYFFLNGVSGHAVLLVSCIGYATQEINTNDPQLLSIRMTLSNSKLDEVQVIAYGETSQRLNTGNVTTVNAREIQQQPVNNPLLALQGRVPGLFITQVNGIPNGGVSVAIRGQNSIQSGNDPLYVIDGVPYVSQLLPGIGGILGQSSNMPQIGFSTIAQNGNPMSFINPADIESISVLKDADATAIYGSRGANGVILVTTRKGKAGQTKVDINVQQGYAAIARKADLLNTTQYLQMRNEALKNDGLTASLDNGDYDLLQWDPKKNTDWQKQLIGNTSQYTNAQGSVSGGNDLTQFLIGGGFNRQTTVYPGDFDDKKASLHFNIMNTSPNRKFSISLTGSYSYDNNRLPQNDMAHAAYTLPPNAPDLLNPDGSINWAPSANGGSTLYNNPMAVNLQTFENKTNNLVANSILSYEILPGLNLRSSFGYTNMQTDQQNLYPLSSQAPENRLYNTNSAIFSTNNINTWIMEPNLTYKRGIGSKGRLEALLGGTIQQNKSKGLGIRSSGYSSEANLGDIAYASSITSNNYLQSVYKYNALFGRLNYNWSDKYLVDLTARRDGSSRFGVNNMFHNFGAAGLGWIFTREDFISKHLPFLSFGKLRASYGTTGNDQLGDYEYLSLYNTVYASVPYQGMIGLHPGNLANPNLEWELTKKLEFGLETGFLHDRILFTASYSHNRSSNQLLGYNLPYVTGFSNIQVNFPATVQNTSWEFSLNTTNIHKGDFSWTSSINLTIPNNKLIAFPGLAASTYANTLVIGQPLSIQKVFHYEGVDPTTGVYTFTSATDKLNPDYNSDRSQIINTLPKFYGGFQNTISYKSFRLDFLFQFTKQTGMNSLYTLGIPGNMGNQFTSVLARWQKPGQVTNIQRYSSVYYNIGTPFYDMYSSDGAYTDASYIRLKNLSLSWQMKENWVKAAHLKALRLFVQGQNLLTITHYKGIDPESPGGSSLPPLRVLTGGIQVDL